MHETFKTYRRFFWWGAEVVLFLIRQKAAQLMNYTVLLTSSSKYVCLMNFGFFPLNIKKESTLLR